MQSSSLALPEVSVGSIGYIKAIEWRDIVGGRNSRSNLPTAASKNADAKKTALASVEQKLRCIGYTVTINEQLTFRRLSA